MTTIQVIFLTIPFLIAFSLGIGGVVGGFLAAARPILVLIPYLALILYFPNASYGLIDVEDHRNFYSRGMGYLFFPAINVMLLGMFLGTAFGRLLPSKVPSTDHNLSGITLWLPLLVIVHLVIGLLFDEKWYWLLQPAAMLNFLNMAMLMFILLRGVRDERELRWLVVLVLVAAITRGGFGVARFVAMGGDPANYYANFQRIDVKLTFFDINDGLIATVVCFGVAHFLLARWREVGTLMRVTGLLAIAMEIFIVAFSYRRTGLIGFGLAALLLISLQPPGRRLRLFALMAAVGVPGIIFVLERRLSTSFGGTTLERLFPDIVQRGGAVSLTTGRFAELYAAYLTMKENLFFGTGIWGQYRGQGIPELLFHRGNFGWMHSGIGHILLKTGIVGVALFGWACIGYLKFLVTSVKQLPPLGQAVCWASAGGFLFSVPNWLFGTPVIEFRTMQLFGLLMAMPYVVYRVYETQRSVRMPTEQPVIHVPQFAR